MPGVLRDAAQRGRVAGRVIDPDGQPIQEAQVFVVTGRTFPDIAAITGRDGRFALGGLSPGRYRLQATATAYEPATVQVALMSGARAEVEIELAWSGTDDGGDGEPYAADEIPGDDEAADGSGDLGVRERPPPRASGSPRPNPRTRAGKARKGAAMDEIRFTFGGRDYAVDGSAYPGDLILLPTRRLLEVGSWLESFPPQPADLVEVEFDDDGKETLEGLAARLGAPLARSV